CTNGVTSLDVW
nr:immunoglobulin heavy chain junction region [Macaca mulatta]